MIRLTSLRKLLSFAVVFAFCATLISCGGSDKVGKKQLKLVHFYMDQKSLWQSNIAEEFEKANPEIDVVIEAIPYGLYTSKILASAATGNPLGDVILIDDWFAQELFKHDYTVSLDSLFARDLKESDFYTQFFKVWRKGNRADQPLMAMPACGGVTALFYNTALFDKAGLGYPDSSWTYDTFLEAAKKLTSQDSDPATKTWGTIIDHGNSTGIDTYLYSNGGKILRDDLSAGAMSEPASIAAMQSYVDLVQKHKVAPQPDPSQSMGQKFLQGRVGMMLTFDVTKQELAKAIFGWDIAPPPSGAGGVMSRQNGQAFGIARESKNPNEAWELIKYIVTLPHKRGVNELYSTAMPLYKPLARSKDFLEGAPRCNRQALLDINNGKVFNLITPGWQEWRDHGFVPNVQDMLAGRKSVEQGCRDIDAKINSVLSTK